MNLICVVYIVRVDFIKEGYRFSILNCKIIILPIYQIQVFDSNLSL